MTSPLTLSLVPSDASTNPDVAKIDLLMAKLDEANREYEIVDEYYTGDQPLAFLAPEIEAQVGNRLTPLVINWPETIVDSVNRRLGVEGFRLGLGGEADEELWRIFSANNLDDLSPLGTADALVHGIVYLSVWGNEADPSTPTIRFESAHQVAVDYDPGTYAVRSGIKRWQDGETTYVTLYLPDRVTRYRLMTSIYGAYTGSRYVLDQELRNPLGAVPIVPMVNRGRLLNSDGRSELKSIAPLADAINKLATDMMTTAEFYVSTRRYVEEMDMPSDPSARERMRAEMELFWEKAEKSKFLATSGKFGQFDEADLDGYVKALNLLTAALAAIGGLPPDDLGLNTTNPASAEARRAAETTLILRAKEKHASFGPAFAQAMRLAVAARDGKKLKDIGQQYSGMKVAWRDPATPAIAAAMDAAVKGVDSGIYDIEAGQEVVGMSPVERAAMKVRVAEQQAEAATAEIRARLDLAERLAGTPITLSPNAALAAAGLTLAASTNSAESAPQTPA